MDFWAETNWFAVQAKPFQETLAAASVAKLNIEVFLPRIKQEQIVCGMTRLLTKPLFNGYFFARFSPLLVQEAVRYARGVLRIVGTSGFPIPLDEEVILAIRSRIEDDGFVRLKSPSFEPGDRVCIERGPWQGTFGRFEQELIDGKRVAILLEAIDHARLLIEKRWLSAVADSD
jgi:transcription antitermination factor NusG